MRAVLKIQFKNVIGLLIADETSAKKVKKSNRRET
jgi:hypothetical protein